MFGFRRAILRDEAGGVPLELRARAIRHVSQQDHFRQSTAVVEATCGWATSLAGGDPLAVMVAGVPFLIASLLFPFPLGPLRRRMISELR